MFFRKKKTSAPAPSISIGPVPVQSSAPGESKDSGEPRKKILLIEDDPIATKMVSFALDRGGYHVLSAPDGASAIRLMRDEKPDMLVVDVGLPPDIASGGAVLSDGFQVTRWLHYANGRKVPAIMISATDRADYRQKAAAAGADTFMPKPIHSGDLLAAVAMSLAKPEVTTSGIDRMRMAG